MDQLRIAVRLAVLDFFLAEILEWVHIFEAKIMEFLLSLMTYSCIYIYICMYIYIYSFIYIMLIKIPVSALDPSRMPSVG